MSKVPQKETKRDQKLIKDYKSGKNTLVDLVSKYRISSTRIYQILNYYNIEKRGKNERQKYA